MLKKVSVALAALLAASLVSGCYVLREVNWSKDQVKKGESTNLRVGLIGFSSDNDPAYVFSTLR